MTKYDILVVDPPWQYKNGSTGKGGKSSSANKYETMTDYDIKHTVLDYIDRKQLVSDNAILFLWTTNSMIRTAIDIMNCWYFDLKTIITWVKKNYGLGNYYRGKTEHILFGTKGKVKALNINLPNVILSEKTLKHSQKPEEFYKYVEAAAKVFVWQQDNIHRCNILELYARKQRVSKINGVHWTCIGKELTGNDVKTDIEKLVNLS